MYLQNFWQINYCGQESCAALLVQKKQNAENTVTVTRLRTFDILSEIEKQMCII